MSGFLDALMSPKIVGKNRKYNLFKFAINNNAGKQIQCLAWENQVDRVANIVKLNKVCGKFIEFILFYRIKKKNLLRI